MGNALKRGLFTSTERVKVRWTVIALAIVALYCIWMLVPNQVGNVMGVTESGLHRIGWKSAHLPRPANKSFRLGLDLLGGTHLVYKADVSNVADSERSSAMDGVKDVIERRVNALGVAEPVVQVTRAGQDWLLSVELAGIKDVKEAIKAIGETPLLEFKEQGGNEPRTITPAQQKEMDTYNAQKEAQAKKIIAEIERSTDKDFGQFVIKYSEAPQSERDHIGDIGFQQESGGYGEVIREIARLNKKLPYLMPQAIKTFDGLSLVRVEEKRETEKEIHAQHLLICYKGAQGCTKETSKDDARKKIEELKKQATPQNFGKLVAENSTEPGAATQRGDLGWFSKGRMVKQFEDAVFAQKTGTISDVVETPFGFHLIYKIEERPLKEYHIQRILLKLKQKEDYLPAQDQWKNTQLSGKQLQRSTLQFDPNSGQPVVGLKFNDEGKKLFGDITSRNVGKPVAIFLDGQPISIPRVNEAITSGEAVITGNFSLPEAKQLVQRLNAGALPVPINLESQQVIGATLGKVSVEQSLYAGMMGFLFIVIFMTLIYRLPGILASVTLLLYVGIILTTFKLLSVTLTLSGIAGFILSMGIAVDGNVLIFERMKEELHRGLPLRSAITEGFRRAWPSIRDGHFTTLITCAILITFTTSLMKGFAVTLAIGVLASLFSAMVITRVLQLLVYPWVQHLWWYGVKK